MTEYPVDENMETIDSQKAESKAEKIKEQMHLNHVTWLERSA